MFTDSQRKTVIANTFTQALGRMNQNHAYNQFAEGLINPDKKRSKLQYTSTTEQGSSIARTE